jgi:hypothetical protein
MFDITAAVQQKNFYLLVSVHHCAIQRRWGGPISRTIPRKEKNGYLPGNI